MISINQSGSEISTQRSTEKNFNHYSQPKIVNLLIIFTIYYALIGQSFNSISFIFLNPVFFCSPTKYQCSQKTFCQNGQNFRDIRQHYGASTIVTQYQLYCDRKMQMAQMQTLNILGHLLGCLIVSFLGSNIKAQKLLKILAMLNVTIGIILILCLFANWSMFSIIYFCSSLLIQIINSTIFAAAGFSYPQKSIQIFLPIICNFYSVYGLFNPLLIWLSGSWRVYLLIFIGVPSIIVGCWLYRIDIALKEQQKILKKQENQDNTQNQESIQNPSLKQIQKIKTTSPSPTLRTAIARASSSPFSVSWVRCVLLGIAA